MPWLEEKNPYKIWISEIMLQQTRVLQAWNYYIKFIDEFPTVEALGNATEDRVLFFWQGLGYYSRARNLHKSAQRIIAYNQGIFPRQHSIIMELPGVGAYTAAAISSFAFNEPIPVVDGNVIRVLSRIYGIYNTHTSSISKKNIHKLATNLLEKQNSARYNQNILNFGAKHCTPKNPNCDTCPFTKECFAFIHKKQLFLPSKKVKTILTERYFHYFHIENSGKVLIEKRDGQDIWKGLYQLPLFESFSHKKLTPSQIRHRILNKYLIDIEFIDKHLDKQDLSHQRIFAFFYLVKVKSKVNKANGIWVNRLNLTNFAFPKIIRLYLDKF